jgi:hypothetical protein
MIRSKGLVLLTGQNLSAPACRSEIENKNSSKGKEMKKLLFIILALLICAGLFAKDVNFYGSARVGYWFDMYDENHPEGGADGRMVHDMFLQNNSRFGANFRDGGLTGKVEFGATGNIRLLYAKQQFENFSILVGQDYDGTDKWAFQKWGSDADLVGVGAVYGGRNPMFKMAFNDGNTNEGFYFALMAPYTDENPYGDDYGIDALIPRINLGYNIEKGDIKVYPTASFQMYQYNEDFALIGSDDDDTVMSWLVAATLDWKLTDEFFLRAHGNFGANTGNMGIDGPGNFVGVKNTPSGSEFVDTMTMGGFLHLGYDLNPELGFGLGFGYASSSNDEWEDDYARMAFYLNSTIQWNNFKLIPEFGMLMDNINMVDNPTMMYFGTQLRMDF